MSLVFNHYYHKSLVSMFHSFSSVKSFVRPEDLFAHILAVNYICHHVWKFHVIDPAYISILDVDKLTIRLTDCLVTRSTNSVTIRGLLYSDAGVKLQS